MDYFLKIYGINNWYDYVRKSITYDYDNNFDFLILSILIKKYPNQIIFTNSLIKRFRNLLYSIQETQPIKTDQDVIDCILKYAKIYTTNPAEPLLSERVKNVKKLLN